jgi:hypothetical protein
MTRRMTRNPVHRCAYGSRWDLGSNWWMLVAVRVDAVVGLCKAGVRGSIPLVSTTLTSGNNVIWRSLFDQWQPSCIQHLLGWRKRLPAVVSAVRSVGVVARSRSSSTQA